jgi:glycosyltransferase involved in cell wall biosynthesis
MNEVLSLIIITYNRPDDLLELLQSLRKEADITPLKEVLILNNASTVSYEKAENFIAEEPRPENKLYTFQRKPRRIARKE